MRAKNRCRFKSLFVCMGNADLPTILDFPCPGKVAQKFTDCPGILPAKHDRGYFM